MSLSTEITRIETAKADIAAAIEEKGVTVPDDTKLDGMAALIVSIEAGSTEAKTELTQIAMSTISGNGTNQITYKHNTGIKPLAIYISAAGTKTTNQVINMAAFNVGTTLTGTQVNTTSSSSSYNIGTASTTLVVWDENTVTIKASDSSAKFVSGKSYSVRLYA